MQNRVELVGILPQDQILNLYHGSDIFTLACVVARNGDRDGIPVVLMEAMACELPVVTTEVAGIPDLVQNGKTGLFVKPRDAAALADALARLIVDPNLRQTLGVNARKIILEKFQIHRNTRQLALIFRQIIQQQQNKGRITFGMG